jgi:hypothetical protein
MSQTQRTGARYPRQPSLPAVLFGSLTGALLSRNLRFSESGGCRFRRVPVSPGIPVIITGTFRPSPVFGVRWTPPESRDRTSPELHRSPYTGPEAQPLGATICSGHPEGRCLARRIGSHPPPARDACPSLPARHGGPAAARRQAGFDALSMNSAEGSVARPFRHESQIPTHSPLLLANRGSAELEMVPSPCKQRVTLLSNRGEIRVVPPLRHRSRITHPSSLPFLIATRAYSREELTHRKHRLIRFSNRNKIHFTIAPVRGREGLAR